MNNIELEQKIKELVAIDSYVDLQLAINAFEAEYKRTDFYKQTKISLKDAVQDARLHYISHLEGLGAKMQTIINNLSWDHLNQLLDQVARTFQQENQDIGEMLEIFKNLH